MESYAQFQALKKNGGAEAELAGESSTALLRLILLDAREHRNFVAGVAAEYLREQREQRRELKKLRKQMAALTRVMGGGRREVQGTTNVDEGTSQGGVIRIERKKRTREEKESGDEVEADERPTKKGKGRDEGPVEEEEEEDDEYDNEDEDEEEDDEEEEESRAE